MRVCVALLNAVVFALGLIHGVDGVEVPPEENAGGTDDPSNHVNMKNYNSKTSVHVFYDYEVDPDFDCGDKNGDSSFTCAGNVMSRIITYSISHCRFKDNKLYINIKSIDLYTGSYETTTNGPRIRIPYLSDLSHVILDFSLPSSFLNYSYALGKVDFPPHLSPPSQHNYNNWTVVVESIHVNLKSFDSIGSFISQNFAQVSDILIFVEDSRIHNRVTAVDEDLFKGLPYLTNVVFSHNIRSRNGQASLPQFDDLTLFPSYPNILVGIESLVLENVTVSVPAWSTAHWNFSSPSMRTLKFIAIEAASLPLPDVTADEFQCTSDHAKDRCEYLDAHVTIRGCSASQSTPLYLEALCDGQFAQRNVSKVRYNNSSLWGIIFGRACLDLTVASACPVPLRIRNGCPLLKDLVFGKRYTDNAGRFELNGFVIDDNLISLVNQLKRYRIPKFDFENVLWDATETLDIATNSFTINLHHSHVDILPVSSPPVFNINVLCGKCPCQYFTVDGGESNSNPPIVTSNYTGHLASNGNDGKQPCHYGAISLSHVYVDDSVWNLLSTPNYPVRKLYLYEVSNVNFRALFPCAVPIDRSTNEAMSQLVSRGTCGANNSIRFNTTQLSIQTRENSQFPFCFDKRMLRSYPELHILKLVNVQINEFDFSKGDERVWAQLKSLSIVNAVVPAPLQTLNFNDIHVTPNVLETLPVLLNGSEMVHLNISYNNISSFDFDDVTVSNRHAPLALGLHTIDISHNLLPTLKIALFRVLNYMACFNCHPDPSVTVRSKLINLSYNKLESFNISDELPPRGYTGVRNLTSPSMLFVGNKTYADYKFNFNMYQQLYIDISHNNLKGLAKGVLKNLGSLAFLNVQYNNISSIANGFLDSSNAYHSCLVDLSHNSLGLRDSLKLDNAFKAPVYFLNLSHNGLRYLPGGLRQISLNYVSRSKRPSWFINAPERFAYPVIDLSHNNIQSVHSSICGGRSSRWGLRGANKQLNLRDDKQYIYVDLSHNDLKYLSADSLDCGDVYLLLNINHNPISRLPELPKKQRRLLLLSAANTSIMHIPNSYSAVDNLFALRSIFIGNSYDGMSSNDNGVANSNILWGCCEIAPLTHRVEDSTLKCINVDTVSEGIDLVASSNLLERYNVQNQKCVFKGEIITYKDFVDNTLNIFRENACGSRSVMYSKDSSLSFALVVTLLLVLLYCTAFLLAKLVTSTFQSHLGSQPLRWPMLLEKIDFHPSDSEGYVIFFNEDSREGIGNYYCAFGLNEEHCYDTPTDALWNSDNDGSAYADVEVTPHSGTSYHLELNSASSAYSFSIPSNMDKSTFHHQK
eukprot:Nk52_evm18s235 gene=Nk52_evmTU18s235